MKTESTSTTTSRGATKPAKRGQRLRSSRVIIQDTMAGDVIARAKHADLGQLTMRVLDLSIHGARLAVDPSVVKQASTVLLGDQLDLSISCRDEIIYQGPGTVTRTLDDGKAVSFGVELHGAGVDLTKIHQTSARTTAEQRWAQAKDNARLDDIDDEFRAWLADVADTLGTTKTFLDREETELSSHDLATQQGLSEELLRAVTPDLVARMNQACVELVGMVEKLPKDLHEDYRAAMQRYLGHFFQESPFFARAKNKPLGYAGDYEMMNMLYRNHAEGKSLFGKAMNIYACSSHVARANINRIDWLGQKIASAIQEKREGRLRVASIGCGPAHEMFSFLSKYPELGERLDVALIDQEDRAILHCERSLGQLAAKTRARVRPIRESARHLLTDRKLGDALGQCDLVYSAGLFDYLAERSFSALLHVLYHALAPSGRLVVGNVAAHNPDRIPMEFFTDWFLYHRSPAELLAQAHLLTPTPSEADVEAEPTGVNLFLVVRR